MTKQDLDKEIRALQRQAWAVILATEKLRRRLYEGSGR